MATLSTHTLNSVDGTHAGGISVTLTRIDADGRRTELFRQATDEGGRLPAGDRPAGPEARRRL